MEWNVWFTWCFLFYCGHSRLLRIYHQKAQNFDWKPPVQIYPDKIKSGIGFEINTGYKLELLTPETMRLLGSTKKCVDKDKEGKNIPKLESVEVFLVHCKQSSQKRLSTHSRSFVNFCSKQTVWTVNKYFATFFNDDEHS